MASRHSHPRRRLAVQTVFAIALLLPLAAANRAEALQCPSGYRGAQTPKGPKCVMTAEKGHAEYKKQQDHQKKQKELQKKQNETAEKIKKQRDEYVKGKKLDGFGKYTKNANTGTPTVPGNSGQTGQATGPVTHNGSKLDPNKSKGPFDKDGNCKNCVTNSGQPTVPGNNATTTTGNKHNAQSGNPTVPGDKPQTGSRDDRDRGDRQAATNDNERGTRSGGRRDDDDNSSRKAAKAAGSEDGDGKRKTAKAATGKTTTTASLGNAAGGSGWVHNDSRMSVASDGNQLTIAYDKPRDGLEGLGIKPGTPLFKGTRTGDKVTGEATTFTRKCGTRTYPVSGSVSDGGARVVLRGDKPVLNGSCTVTGTTNETLEFETGS